MRERPFEFSAFPGRYATPLVGASAAVLVGVAGQLAARGERHLPLMLLSIGAALLAAAGAWLATRGVLRAPVLRRRGMNLEAARPSARPTIWLSAHVDTKSQPVPTLLRTLGILVLLVGFVLTLAVCAAIAAGVLVHAFFWTFAAILTLAGAVPVVMSVVGDRSPGALDNASGVATVLAAARMVKEDPNVGVLITDAEELGLAGARAWTVGENARGTGPSFALNCDGVDDSGHVQVMFSGRRPRRLADAVARAARAGCVPCSIGRLIPGVLTDSVAFTAAGISSMTFSRGSWRSLARVHRPADNLAGLRGTGVRDVAILMATTVRELTREHPIGITEGAREL